MSKELPTPKVFLSYSWSSDEHQAWVDELANRLVHDGIDVVYDKWDLKAGHEASAFMELMVTDTAIQKVLMVCDSAYQTRANDRAGGVGAESQIISAKLFAKSKQDKFVALVKEFDSAGQACTPAFYGSRIYFDLSSDDRFEDGYDELLRWLFGKPRYVKPKLGKPPSHISELNPQSGSADGAYRRMMHAISTRPDSSVGAIFDYSAEVFASLKTGVIRDVSEALDEQIVSSINASQPVVRQISSLAIAIARSGSQSVLLTEALVRLFERLIPLMDKPDDISGWMNGQFDNLVFIVNQSFVSSVAALLKEERYDLVQVMLEAAYLVKPDGRSEKSTRKYSILVRHMPSLEMRNRRLKLNRISVEADMLNEFCRDGVIDFRDYMQADMVLYLHDKIIPGDEYDKWYPVSLVYAMHYVRAFDMFGRAESMKYFQKIRPLFNNHDVAEFKQIVSEYQKTGNVVKYDHMRLPIAYLCNVAHLGSKP